ncbi:putative fad-binding domain-containing protein [Phaeomoniella chlamydospora]|uniref:ferric-chelate reductase (NADPH) n=1 Tax=Phaeomoniella chlamydospora TaxID=158046 RepID=A0A0G2GF82_PHACM|nr:putative fad-binding domain-containing protein [Phaeomoniella chlamydospora]
MKGSSEFSEIHDCYSTMNPALLYAIIVVATFVTPVILKLGCTGWYLLNLWPGQLLLKHLVYPFAFGRWRPWTSTRLSLLLQAAYFGLNFAFNVIGVYDVGHANQRSAILAAVNWLPLTFTGQPSFIASITGLSLQTIIRAHGTVGVVLLVQAAALLCMALSCLFITLRRRLYEIIMKFHYGLSLVALGALWKHLEPRTTFPFLYIAVATCMLSSITAARVLYVLFRNVARGEPLSRATVEPLDGAVKLSVTIPTPFRVRAGQYVHLWIPGIDFWSFFQAHPYTIAWWCDDYTGQATRAEFLVRCQRGFSDRFTRNFIGANAFLSCIDGPYGVCHDLGDYGSVLLFATEIGIAAQIPYVKELVRGFRDFKVRTRRIRLHWQIDQESNQNWVDSWFNEILDGDPQKDLIQIRIYQTKGGDLSEHPTEKFGSHNRVWKIHQKMNIEEIFSKELNAVRANMAVSVCSNMAVRNRVRELVRENVQIPVRLFESEFQPDKVISPWLSKPRA